MVWVETMNSNQQDTLLATFEQAGTTKIRRAITSGRWPLGEVRDLAEGWLMKREGAETETAMSLAQDANMTAHEASNAADNSNRKARVSNLIAAAAFAMAFLA